MIIASRSASASPRCNFLRIRGAGATRRSLGLKCASGHPAIMPWHDDPNFLLRFHPKRRLHRRQWRHRQDGGARLRPGRAQRHAAGARATPAQGDSGAVVRRRTPVGRARVCAEPHGARPAGLAEGLGRARCARVAPVDAMAVNGDGKNGGSLGFDAFGAHAGTLAWIVEDSNLNSALDAALKFAHKVEIVKGCATRLTCGPKGAAWSWKTGAASMPGWYVAPTGAIPGCAGSATSASITAPTTSGDRHQFFLRKAAPRRRPPVVHLQRRHHRAAAAAGQARLAGVVGAGNPGRHPDGGIDGRTGRAPVRIRRRAARHPEALQPESVKAVPLALVRPHALITHRTWP
jgi:hypothetical protein